MLHNSIFHLIIDFCRSQFYIVIFHLIIYSFLARSIVTDRCLVATNEKEKKNTLMKMHQIRFCVSLGSPLDQVINPVKGVGRGGGGGWGLRYFVTLHSLLSSSSGAILLLLLLLLLLLFFFFFLLLLLLLSLLLLLLLLLLLTSSSFSSSSSFFFFFVCL